MKNIKNFSFVILVNILFLLILCEGLGLIYFYYTNSELFYGRKRAETTLKEESYKSEQINTRLHPFWGFIPRPGMNLKTSIPKARLDRLVGQDITPEWINTSINEYGFWSSYTYPYVPKKNEFVIGIFGGSVASWFALQGREALIQSLQQNNSWLKDRSIVILSFAQGGFKEPQQLQVLTYFLAIGQHFDLVINIDGFNEVALSHLNYEKNIDLSFPSSQHIVPIIDILDHKSIDTESLEALLNLGKARSSLRSIEGIMARNQSAGLNLIFTIIHRYRSYNYGKKTIQFDELNNRDNKTQKSSIMQLNQLQSSINPKNEFDYVAQLWASSSILMQQILEKQRINYFHVLQPNQYYCQRTFTSEETFAVDPKSPYKFGVEHGYPFLLKQVDRLQKHGVYFIDATKIFDATPKIVYSDSCCHYNQIGNELLAAFIARNFIPITDGKH